MLQRPLARKPAVFTTTTEIVPPPVGGWNARDTLDNMDPRDAILLDNWFPRERDVVIRDPFEEYCDTGETGKVVGLHAHNGAAASELIAFVAGKAIKCETGGATTELISGLNVGAEVFGYEFAGRSFFLNGEDAPQSYDGTTFASAGIAKDAGESETLDNTLLTFGMGYKSRMYMAGDNRLGFWYGTVRGVTGAIMKYFPLDAVFTRGGSLAAMGSMSDDIGNAGLEDFACFVSTKGEVAIYSGSNPDDVSNWAVVGVYDIGEPVSRFGIVKYGADLVVITKGGYIPLRSVISSELNTSTRFALSDKISDEARSVTDRFQGNSGWRVIVVPNTSKLIVNVPRSAVATDQHVMNTVTRSWCRFREITAMSMAVFNADAYFGGADGKVYIMESDNFSTETAVTATAEQAWNYFRRGGNIKQFTQAQPIFVSSATPLIEIGFAVDFSSYIASGSVQASADGSISVWNGSVWDVAQWSGTRNAVRKWVGLAGIGYAGSLRVRAAEVTSSIEWKSVRVMHKPGGPR